ncbi:MAG TPA: enoyl-ACP reductase [Candidatus Udaeobacter sp.]|jgi:enoyl-[acyl-carrier protein] reductase I|nr:enoyl-ACP reductase [Candidatus Udaeobacter sp.]
MYAIDLKGRGALVMGVANHRSLSWAIAQALHQAGARLCLTYAGDRLKDMVGELAATLPGTLLLECDVTRDDTIDAVRDRLTSEWGSIEAFVHGVAFARKEDLEGAFVATPREGFQLALDISAYSLINVTNRMLPLFEKNGAAIVTLSYLAAERAVPSYNVMGSAKAVLEQSVRQLAFELGPKNIRINALSAGPVSTLAARGIHGFTDMLKKHAEKAPLQRNITKEEVGRAGLFLLCDLSSGITGETLYVDAGYHVMAW